MSTSLKPTKAAALAQVQALIAGTTKHFPTGSFTIGNTTYTSATLVQVLQGLANALSARDAAEAGAKDVRAAAETAHTQVGPIVTAYKRIVVAAFASANQTLADFGHDRTLGSVPMSSPTTPAMLA
jgi:hypothetical protein